MERVIFILFLKKKLLKNQTPTCCRLNIEIKSFEFLFILVKKNSSYLQANKQEQVIYLQKLK